ncbi:SLOG family protein [Streptomyces sp. NPDC005004]
MMVRVKAELSEPRVLVCGSRRWRWPATVESALDRLTTRYGDRLVVIEGAASGADRAAHDWCNARGLGAERHRCFPVDWQAERRARPKNWSAAGPERNTRMLLEETPSAHRRLPRSVRSGLGRNVRHVSAGPTEGRARVACPPRGPRNRILVAFERLSGKAGGQGPARAGDQFEHSGAVRDLELLTK